MLKKVNVNVFVLSLIYADLMKNKCLTVIRIIINENYTNNSVKYLNI